MKNITKALFQPENGTVLYVYKADNNTMYFTDYKVSDVEVSLYYDNFKVVSITYNPRSKFGTHFKSRMRELGYDKV